jgi:phosphotransferase system enzyme I (PtsI)
MFPMVSGLQEILDVREVLREVQEELDQAGTPYDPDMKVGVMIEIPSAVMMADVLASHVDFFSIGTNDLIQYALAIDRINEHVAYMYQPYHPAIVKMVHLVVRAAEEKGIPVSLCGEMAGDPLCVPILLGMGLRCLSMNARAIPLIKKLIRSITLEEARADFAYVNGLNTAKSVQAYLLERVQGVLPDIDLKRYM